MKKTVYIILFCLIITSGAFAFEAIVERDAANGIGGDTFTEIWSKITSGIISLEDGKLDKPEGMPDDTKFVRGDGVLATPPGSTILAGTDPTKAAVAEAAEAITFILDDANIPDSIARDTELFDASSPGTIGGTTPGAATFTDVETSFVDGAARLKIGSNTTFDASNYPDEVGLTNLNGVLKQYGNSTLSDIGSGGSTVTASVVEALYAFHDTTAPVVSSLAASPSTQDGTETVVGLTWINTEANPQKITWSSTDGGSGELAGDATSLNHTISAGRTENTVFTLTPRDWAGQTGTAQTVTVSYDAGQAYDFEENFETLSTGYENSWSILGGSPDPIATPALREAQSLSLESSTDSLEASFTAQSEIWIAFRIELASSVTADSTFIELYDGSNTRSISFRVRADGTAAIYSPGGSNINGTTIMASGTVYYVWMHWKRGTGDCEAHLYVSTSRVMPASPEVTRDTWSYEIDVSKIRLLRTNGVNVKFDQVIANSTTIGDLDE